MPAEFAAHGGREITVSCWQMEKLSYHTCFMQTKIRYWYVLCIKKLKNIINIRIRKVLGLADPDPVASSKNSKKTFDFCFVTFYL
jgi:hypothetical protein